LKIWVWKEKSVEPSMCSHWVQLHRATLVYIRFRSNSTRGVSHHGLAIYIKKYLKAKEELRKFKYFTMQKYNLKKNPLKETKMLQKKIIISSFNTSQNTLVQKSSYKNRPTTKIP
jgi:hypothetical protein